LLRRTSVDCPGIAAVLVKLRRKIIQLFGNNAILRAKCIDIVGPALYGIRQPCDSSRVVSLLRVLQRATGMVQVPTDCFPSAADFYLMVLRPPVRGLQP